MTEVSFAHGVACGGVLTRAQVAERQQACTRLAEAGLPDTAKYRSWKAAMLQEASQNPYTAKSPKSYKAVSWITALTVLVLAVFAFSSELIPSGAESALDALSSYDWRAPVELASSYLPAFHLPEIATDTNTSTVTGALFPEIGQQVNTVYLQESNSSNDSHSTDLLHPHALARDAANLTSSSLESQIDSQNSSQSSDSSHSAAADFTQFDWAFEDNSLRAAELECELAQMREENQQLSAHVLSATRQLAAIGQTVQIPHSDNLHARNNKSWSSVGRMWTAFLVMLLSLASFGIGLACRRASWISAKPAAHGLLQSEQVQGLQQELQKLDRQVGKQQTDLMSAEQTIMSLSSGKAAVEVELRVSQQKVAGLQADLARAECLMDSHAVSKLKLPLFPMSPLAQPPLPRTSNKENVSRLAKSSTAEAAACAEAKQAAQPDREALLAKLRQMEAEKAALEGELATSQAEQAGVREACSKAQQQCSAMQADAEALELRMFTTHEQLAVAQEREADLVAQLQQARQTAAPPQALSCAHPQADTESDAETANGQDSTASAAKQDDMSKDCQSASANQLSSQDGQASTSASDTAVSSQARPFANQSPKESSATASQETVNQPSSDNAASSSRGAAPSLARSASLPTAVGTASTSAASAATAVEHENAAEGTQHRQTGLDEEANTTAGTDAEFFPKLVCRVKGGESSEMHRMQSSPIYGVANVSSSEITPPRSLASRARNAGPKTPWSADWVTSFLSTGKGSHSSRRAGSITPTRLFEFNGDNTAPDPEKLFDCWHSK